MIGPRTRTAIVAVALAVAPGCRCSSSSTQGIATAPSAASSATTASPADSRASIDPIASFDECVVGHDGVLLDLGEKAADRLFSSQPRPDVEDIERSGITFARVRSKAVALSYFAGAEAADEAPTYVTLRIRGGAAKNASIFVNGKPAGVVTLTKDEITSVTARSMQRLVAPGRNEILIRFGAVPKTAGGEPLGEIDWVHVGSGDPDPAYAAPTRSDVSAHATLGGVSKEAIALRAPGFLRCIGWLPKSANAGVSLGIEGTGDADVEVRVLRDRQDAKVLEHTTVAAGQPWTTLSLPIEDDPNETDGTLGAFEVAVTRAAKGARVLVGEPRITAPPSSTQPTTQPAAKGVILVVLGDVSLRALRLYGGQSDLPALDALAEHALVFDQNRSNTTFASGAFASMLTGRAARAIKMDVPDARLPASVVTVADAARQAGVVTGIFSANPTTQAAFGFDRSWETSVARSPEEAPATRVLDDAATWIEAHKADRFLAVIHARGGHPPWDATPDELKNMAPANYMGSLDPRHAGELLARARHVPPALHLTDADRERMWALYAKSLASTDVALGNLFEAVKRAGRDDDTMIIVTSDVPVDESARVPFGEGGPPEEIALLTPLVVRPAAHGAAGSHVRHRTADLDVAKTILDALGLAPPPDFDGVDLLHTAAAGAPASGRPLLATARDKYALAWGDFILAGSAKHSLVCVASLDPACALDTRATHPIAAQALEEKLFSDLAALDAAGVTGETAKPEVLGSSALRTWGRTQ